MSKATLLTKVTGWAEGQASVGMYMWWSPNELIAFFDSASQRLLDLHTKTWRTFPLSIPARYRSTASPDRTRYIDSNWEQRNLTWSLHSVHGKQLAEWTTRTRTTPPGRSEVTGYARPSTEWSEDGSAIYEVESWPEKKDLKIRITKRGAANPSIADPYPTATTRTWDSYPVFVGNQAILIQFNLESNKLFPFEEWPLADPSQRKQWKVHAPKGKVFIQYIPSPDRKAALWVMGEPNRRPLTDHGYPYLSVSLWVSGLRGENLREIGTLPFHSKNIDTLMDRYQHFGEIQWNPDGKRVSFIFDRKLYLVDVSK